MKGAIVRVADALAERMERWADADLPQSCAADCAIAAERLRAMQRGHERYEWMLPILTGESDPTIDRRTAALAFALTRGLSGADALDYAMQIEAAT